MTPMRQVVVGSQGGAEALAIFLQLIFDERRTGSLEPPLVALWIPASGPPLQTRNSCRLEPNSHHCGPGRVEPMPKHRGAQHRDADGPPGCSLASDMVAAQARLHVAGQQAGVVLWFGPRPTSSLVAQKSSQDQTTRDMLCERVEASAKTQKSSTTFQTWTTLTQIGGSPKFGHRPQSPRRRTATLPWGVAVGSRQCVADHLLATADVIRAMRERVQLCQNPQTEFACLPKVWESGG